MPKDISKITSRAESLNQENSLRDMATQYHYAISSIFGEDVRSEGIDGAIRSQAKDFLAESIALVRREDAEQIGVYLQKNKPELREELRSAIKEYGISDPDVTKNIGPTVPILIAIAEHEYDKDW
jgi:hypothetical protein